jgi:hypothetical protein
LWTWERMSLLSSSEFAKYVFFEEEGAGDWDCGDGIGDGGYGVLGYGAAIAPEGRVCMDDEESGVYPIGMFGDL